MFKRRGVYEAEEEYRGNNYRDSEVPPRIFDTSTSPYRTPTQAYPHHREETQDTLNKEVSSEENWQPSAMGERLELEEPETTIGQGIRIKGELAFERYVRIDGEFEGELLSDGKIVVGPNGTVRADITMREAVVEGTVEGNITVTDRLELRGDAKVYGNIQARLLAIDEGVTIVGNLTVKPAHQETSS